MIAKRKLSVADFLLLGESGAFGPDERVELIDGEVYTVSPPSSRHAAWVDRVMKALERTFGDRTIVRVQSPVKLSPYDVPEPDVAVLVPQADFYESELPGAQAVHLVVEVSLSSLSQDRARKLLIYAAAGVSEAWIVNVDEGQEVYREPLGGRYRLRLLLDLDEPVTPVAIPDARAVVLLP